MRKTSRRQGLAMVLRLDNRPVILVGEGAEAEAIRRMLEREGARIVAEGSKSVLGIVVGDDAGAISRLKVRGVLVHAIDRPDLSDFSLPGREAAPAPEAPAVPAPVPTPAPVPPAAPVAAAPAPPVDEPGAIVLLDGPRGRGEALRRLPGAVGAAILRSAPPVISAVTALARPLRPTPRDRVALDAALARGGPLDETTAPRPDGENAAPPSPSDS
ncbi:hypothetical protein [Sphingomonas jatrophae]|uniref:Uncharacterized protein n=1 Tax=Sphingomonas jatrophae TaxID=1166337 RepID=A0A1I6M5P1_9SPHN|nr:hypothetical protein [Sphingomonas jatrophae]SFS11035.1 hypothetical protein SAMN05192580_3512 [Sphingomonas jatrophae]